MSSSSELSNSQSYSTQHSSSSSETALPLHQSPSSSSSTSELSNSNSNSSHLSLHLDQRTHYFVFADSAKPIFSRYDDASHYMTFFSAFQALLAHEPELRSIHLPSGHVLVFLPQPPLMLVTIHPHPCMAYQSLLRDQLVYLYHFVVFLVSKSQLHHWFQLKPNLDLTQILGTSSLHQLQLLCDLFDQNLSYCFLSIETIPVPSSLRKKFGMALTHGAQLIKNSSTKKCLYGMLLYQHTLLTLIRPKTHSLHPIDLSHVLTLITYQAQFKQHEHWVPLCLPKWNDQGFLFCYVHYFHAKLGLVLCSNDPNTFFELQLYQHHVHEYLLKNDLLDPLHSFSVIPIDPSQLVQDRFLLHFVYKSKHHIQFLQSQFPDPDQVPFLVSKYRSLRTMLHQRGHPMKFFWVEDDDQEWTGLAWDTSEFEFYGVWRSGVPRLSAIRHANLIVKYIKEHDQDLFIIDAPTFDW